MRPLGINSRWLQWVWASKCSAHADTDVVRAA